MATFAKIGLNSQVIQLLNMEDSACLDAQGNFDETIGAELLEDLHRFPAAHFKLANQNMRHGILNDDEGNPMDDQSSAFRKHCAELNGTYDSVRDAFLPRQVYPSWTFNYTTWEWEPPVEKPADEVDGVPRRVSWNEDTTSWDIS
jgi:hypothetical protein|tara:strand:- start:360 stop:794 length:435 start_codon:yes stop_codon:yes gene_type:complete